MTASRGGASPSRVTVRIDIRVAFLQRVDGTRGARANARGRLDRFRMWVDSARPRRFATRPTGVQSCPPLPAASQQARRGGRSRVTGGVAGSSQHTRPPTGLRRARRTVREEGSAACSHKTLRGARSGPAAAGHSAAGGYGGRYGISGGDLAHHGRQNGGPGGRTLTDDPPRAAKAGGRAGPCAGLDEVVAGYRD